jgi:hypothetical protein
MLDRRLMIGGFPQGHLDWMPQLLTDSRIQEISIAQDTSSLGRKIQIRSQAKGLV